jgi:hypothetical protein
MISIINFGQEPIMPTVDVIKKLYVANGWRGLLEAHYIEDHPNDRHKYSEDLYDYLEYREKANTAVRVYKVQDSLLGENFVYIDEMDVRAYDLPIKMFSEVPVCTSTHKLKDFK